MFGIRQRSFQQIERWLPRQEFLQYQSYNDILDQRVRDRVAEIAEYDPIYHPCLLNCMRHQFPGLDSIKENYSQSWQDMFVLTMHNGLRNGTYLELGASEPSYMNNTCLLEQFGWTGPSIDFRSELKPDWDVERPTANFLLDNILDLDFSQLLANMPQQIDYLQVDLDETASLGALKRLPHDGYRFSVITFETDVFAGNQHIQQQAQTFLQDLGYQLLIKNVAVKNYPTSTWEAFEDWYIDPTIIDPDIAQVFLDTTDAKKLPHEIFINDTVYKR